jgi:integrase
VYTGDDPLTGRRHYVNQTVPPGPDAARQAEKIRTRLLNELDEGRNARTNATVNELMDHYLGLLDVDATTRRSYEGYIRNHVRPLLGKIAVGRLNGETLDKFYTTLRACREHCGGGRTHTKHRTTREHECDVRCTEQPCKGLSNSSIRQIHWCLSGALKRAVRWRWIAVNPLGQAEPPSATKPNPHPPTPEQAAAIVNEAFKDLPWGVLVWLAMVTGARRGELCALRWNLLDLDNAVLWIQTSIAQDGAKTWEKETKTHQQRRIALDEVTLALLRAYRQHCDQHAAEFERQVAADGRIFSSAVDHSTWVNPDTVSQRYRRMCARKPLRWDMNIHQLRHYSATELISSGVDVRTVAGRLGHGGGGSTTLRVYSAWVAESDQRAAGNLGTRMPALPISVDSTGAPLPVVQKNSSEDSPYRQIAADLRGAITSGILQPGDILPTVTDLSKRYGYSLGTVQRAIAELRSAGLIVVSRGRRATVAAPQSRRSVAAIIDFPHR